MFKNETHNHPTEIEPFGGAATCLGGAIRDPLSGRSYVYQAMRVTGSGDPRTSIDDTLPGKLPQRKITYFPSLLEPRKMSEKALLNVVQEAYVHGVSTRKVDELVEALGMKGIDKSEVSRISKQLDEFVEEFKNRRLEGEYPYLWLDATFPKVREGGRVCSMALVIAVGVNQQGEREILGFDVGMSEDGAFWEEFLRRLVARV